MATRTWAISHDATTRGTDVDAGNTADSHHPVGRHQSVATVYRAFLDFVVDTSGMVSISSAILHLRSTSMSHIEFGSSPTLRVKRLTSSLANTQGGSYEGWWASDARPTRSTEPSSTTTGQSAATNQSRTTNAWGAVDITSIAQAWLAGSTNYGIMVKAEDESTNADAWEFYSQNSSYDPYITVTYSATVPNTAPSASPAAPLTGSVASLAYTAGSGWANPRPTVSWTYSDPESDAQSAYQVIVYNDSTGSPGTTLVDSGKVASADAFYQITAALTEGSYYHWKVQVWDAHDLVSAAYTATQRFRVRWGAAEYYFDTGSTPTGWGTPKYSSTGNMVVEYNSTTNTADPGAGLGTWQATIAPVPLQQYIRYRVWLLPGTSAPSLSEMTIPYSGASLPVADNWGIATSGGGIAVVDDSTQVYGTRSMKVDNTTGGSDAYIHQTVEVRPNTQYMVSCWVHDATAAAFGTLHLWDGVSGGFVYDGITGVQAGSVTRTGTYTGDWVQIWTSFNTGALARLKITLGADYSNRGVSWFDAVQVQASNNLTPWRPSTVSGAVTLDASGIRVDGSMGGTMRLRGSTGGTRDTVEIGTNGLLFGGDTQLSSYEAGNIVLRSPSGNMPYFSLWRVNDTSFRSYMSEGGLFFGPGNAVQDVNLYRNGTDLLKTDDKFDPAHLNLQIKAGVPSDSDIGGGAASGDIVIDTTNSRIYVRVGTTWKYVNLT